LPKGGIIPLFGKEGRGEILDCCKFNYETFNEPPRCRDSGVSKRNKLTQNCIHYNPHNPPNPLLKRGFKESPQQRLWGIENLIKKGRSTGLLPF